MIIMYKIEFPKVSELAWAQKKVIKNVQKNKNIYQYIIETHILILICTMLFGATLGVFAKGPQIMYDALKIPILWLVTLYITLPIIFIVDVMLENKITFSQTSVLLLLGFTTASIVLIAFTPLILFFIISAPDYNFITLLTIVISGFAGFFGIISILSSSRRFHKNKTWNPSLIIGSFIIFFVGTQLAWTLRPFFHFSPGFIRPIYGNFYVALARVIQHHPIIATILILIFGLIALFVIIIRTTTDSETEKSIKSSQKVKTKQKLKSKKKPTQKPIYPYYPPIYDPAEVLGITQTNPPQSCSTQKEKQNV